MGIFAAAAVVKADGFLFFVRFFLTGDTEADAGKGASSGFGNFLAAFFAILQTFAVRDITAGAFYLVVYGILNLVILSFLYIYEILK